MSPEQRKMSLLAFLSGGTLIASEALSFKFVDFTVGSYAFNYQVVVVSFIMGAALGGLLSQKLKSFYWIELILAAIHLGLAYFPEDFIATSGYFLGHSSLRSYPHFLSSFLSFLYTFPVALGAGVLFPVVCSRGRSLKTSYGLYATGGAFFFFLIEFWLYPYIGLFYCFVLTAVIHLFSTWLLLSFRKEVVIRSSQYRHFSKILIIAGVMTGWAQGLWSNLAQLYFRPYYYISPSVAFIFIFGIGLGSLLVKDKWMHFTSSLLWSFYGLCWGGLGLFFYGLATTKVPTNHWHSLLILALFLLPATIPIGFLFPSFFRKKEESTSAIAWEYLGLSLGNCIGLIISGVGYYFIPNPLRSYSILLCLFWAFVIFQEQKEKYSFFSKAIITLSFPLALFPYLIPIEKVIERSRNFDIKVDRLDASFGALGEFAVVFKEKAGHIRLYQNGHSSGKIKAKNLIFEELIAGRGMGYAKKLDKGLILGAGYGRTAGFASFFMKETIVMDLGLTVPELLNYFGSYNYQLSEKIEEKKNIDFFRMDGALAPFIFKKHSFDLIVSTVYPPYFKSATKLYTKESMKEFKSLLNSDGIFVTWMTSHYSPLVLQVLANTAQAVFPYCNLHNNWDESGHKNLEYVLLICSPSPLVFNLQRHAKLWNSDFPSIDYLKDTGPDVLKRKVFYPTKAIHSFFKPAASILWSGYH